MYPTDPHNSHGGRFPSTSHQPTGAGPVPVSTPPLPQSTYGQQPYNAYQGYPQQQQPFVPGSTGYAAPAPNLYAQHAGGAAQQHAGYGTQQQQPYDPMQYAAAQQQQAAFGVPDQASGDAQVFMPSLSPMNLMAGTLLAGGGQGWGQQYVAKVQQRTGSILSWLSGGASFHFSVTNAYVRSKLFMLSAPYLRRWTYCRQPDQVHAQVQGGQQFLPPRLDVHSPDLYLPVMGLWTYVIGVLMLQLVQHKYKPDSMYALVWSACFSWCVHSAFLAFILRAMALGASVQWLDLLSYTGYAYLPACAIIVAGVLAGKWGYYGAWLYLSCCMAVFLVRTLKRAVFQEARDYGRDLTLTNYLLLSLAVFQFPFLFWLTNVPLPQLPQLLTHVQAAMAGAAPVAAGLAAGAAGAGVGGGLPPVLKTPT